jgi:hypothetical protein
MRTRTFWQVRIKFIAFLIWEWEMDMNAIENLCCLCESETLFYNNLEIRVIEKSKKKNDSRFYSSKSRMIRERLANTIRSISGLVRYILHVLLPSQLIYILYYKRMHFEITALKKCKQIFHLNFFLCIFVCVCFVYF